MSITTTIENFLSIILGDNVMVKSIFPCPYSKIGKMVHYIEFHGTTATMRIEQDIREIEMNGKREPIGVTKLNEDAKEFIKSDLEAVREGMTKSLEKIERGLSETGKAIADMAKSIADQFEAQSKVKVRLNEGVVPKQVERLMREQAKSNIKDLTAKRLKIKNNNVTDHVEGPVTLVYRDAADGTLKCVNAEFAFWARK